MKIKKTTITVEINNKPRNPLVVIAHNMNGGSHQKPYKSIRRKEKIDIKNSNF